MRAQKKISKEESGAEDKQSRDYELVFIISPEVGDEALETAIGNVSQFVTSKGGIVSDEERWGKRKLAYPINHFLEGNYVLTRLKLKPMWSRELEANLEISEDILRHLLIKVSV